MSRPYISWGKASDFRDRLTVGYGQLHKTWYFQMGVVTEGSKAGIEETCLGMVMSEYERLMDERDEEDY
jgi:hypothetical protein